MMLHFFVEQNVFVCQDRKCGMLVIDALKCKISDFLNSNMCYCSLLYGKSYYVDEMSSL